MFVLVLLFSSVASLKPYTYEFDKGGLYFENVGDYQRVLLKGTYSITQPGYPSLPKIVKSFVIPSNAQVDSIEIIDLKKEILKGKYNVYPAQHPRPLSFDVEYPFQKDREIYSSAKEFPEAPVEVVSSGKKNGFNIVNIAIYPVGYNPSSGRLTFYSQITFRIKLKETSKNTISLFASRNLNEITNEIKSLVENPEDVSSFAPDFSIQQSKALSPDTVDYVVVAYDSTALQHWQPLIDWKTKKGVPAKGVTISWILANYSGSDDAEKLRNFIIDAYNTWGTLYFLLGGQGDWEHGECLIPRRDAWYITSGAGHYPDEDTIPTDLYFSDLDGNWDGDGDGVYGEETDNVDMYADVYVGRAPVKNTVDYSDIDNFVNKVLTYEKNPDTDYLKKILLPAVLLFPTVPYYGDSVNNAIADYTPPGWQDSKLYESYGNLTQSAMVDSMNAGFGFCHHADHGDEYGMYTAYGITVYDYTDADAATNGNKLTVLNAISCFIGAIDEANITAGYDCFVEHLINRVGGGCVAAMGNSRYGWGTGTSEMGPSEVIDTCFYRRLFVLNQYHLGEVHSLAKNDLIPYVTSRSTERWCIYEYNLFGDPEMPLWTDNPVTMTVEHPATIPVGTSILTITVKNSDGVTPLGNALVCVMNGSDVYERGYTDASGNISLTVTTNQVGYINLTVTSQNHLPYEDSIQVITSSTPYIVYLKHTILDTIVGNANGVVNPGETFDLPLWIKNWGTVEAFSVAGSLRVYSGDATVFQDYALFGDIPSADSALSLTPYRVSVNESALDGEVIPCSLYIRDSNDSLWVSGFDITVRGIPLAQMSVDSLVFDYSFKSFKVINGLKGDTDTLHYDNGTYVMGFTGPNFGAPNLGVRFVPPQECKVVGALFGLRHTIAVYDTAYIYDAIDDTITIPTQLGTFVEKVPFVTAVAPSGYPVWQYVSFSGTYSDDDPFWICIYQNYTYDNLSYIGLTNGTGRHSFYRDGVGNWYRLYDAAYFYDYMLRAVVSYANVSDSGIIWIKNIGSADIVVDTIYVKNRSAWITEVTPTSFSAISPSDSGGIIVKIDTTGLAREGSYVDTIVISSNATTKGEIDVPVIIRFSALGIEVSTFFAVNMKNGVSLHWIDNSPEIEKKAWILERKRKGGKNFEVIDRVLYNGSREYSYIDNVESGEFTYRLGVETENGVRYLASTECKILPMETRITVSNVRGKAVISLSTGEEGRYSLSIYDICGREFKRLLTQRYLKKAEYRFEWDIPHSGIYFIRLFKDGQTRLTKKCVFLIN